jgi:hypothetical protein
MAVCGREAAQQRMLRRAAARVGEERASTSIVRGKRHARLLTNLVSLRIPEEGAAAQVSDMRLSPASEVRDACSCRVIPSAYSTRIEIGSGKYRGLVRVRRGMRWPAGLPYMPLGSSALLKCMYIYTLHPLDSIFVWALQTKTRKRHLALVLKGFDGLNYFIVELKHIITPTKAK